MLPYCLVKFACCGTCKVARSDFFQINQNQEKNLFFPHIRFLCSSVILRFQVPTDFRSRFFHFRWPLVLRSGSHQVPHLSNQQWGEKKQHGNNRLDGSISGRRTCGGNVLAGQHDTTSRALRPSRTFSCTRCPRLRPLLELWLVLCFYHLPLHCSRSNFTLLCAGWRRI